MINYSISLRANPSDQDAPKKAYANAQYSEIMTLDKFAEHIWQDNASRWAIWALSPFISTAWEPNHWKHTIPPSMWKT